MPAARYLRDRRENEIFFLRKCEPQTDRDQSSAGLVLFFQRNLIKNLISRAFVGAFSNKLGSREIRPGGGRCRSSFRTFFKMEHDHI